MKTVIVIYSILIFTNVSSAGITVFSDDFNTENNGIDVVNYVSFTNWTVSDGAVDLHSKVGIYDFSSSQGLVVDMDGTQYDAGKITSNAISLQAGTYELSYELAGNHRDNSTEKVNVKIEGYISLSHSLAITDPFTLFKVQFVLPSQQDITICFEGEGSDNKGMLLDNIKLENVCAVPVPSAFLLVLMGTGMVGWLKRRWTL